MSKGFALTDAVWTILHEALEVYRDSPSAARWLGQHIERFDGPPRIAVAGAARSGKSTVVNAIVGEEIAPVTVAGGAQVLTWYRDGTVPRATVYAPQGATHDVPVSRLDNRLHIDLRQWQQHHINRVAVQWPARMLRYATLIDTPAGAQLADEADATLHLVRNVDDARLADVATAQDSPVARAAPVSTILVLSRADEVGAGRVDALSSARLVARRHDRDPRVRSVCQQVIPVAGLVGYAGRTLTEAEFAALAQLATVPRAGLEGTLLSTDRFLRAETPSVPVGPDIRRALLERFGIFGIRLATTLVRGGCDSVQKLSAELVRRSGLGELREAISRDFTDRQRVLKARSALLALERLLATEPHPGTRQLSTDLERVLASAHDFRELRLLAALRSGRTRLPAVLVTEAQQLLGGHGTSVAARLGFDIATDDAELRAAAKESVGRWRDQAENPVLSQDQRRAAGVVVRSCEGMLAQLA